jgi:uncharacterized protein YciI
MTTPIFVITLNYIKPIEEVDKHLVNHRAYLDKFYASGVFVTSGRQNPLIGGVIVARSFDNAGKKYVRADIENIMNNDPFITNDVTSYSITEFTPVKYSEEFKKILGI